MYLHYADMIANGYQRTMPCPFQSQGLLLNPNGDLHYCENSQKLGNVLDDARRVALLQGREPRAPRASQERGLPDLPEPVPGQRRRDEAVRALREVPQARLPGEAGPGAASRHAAGRRARTRGRESSPALLRIVVAVGLTAFVVWTRIPRAVFRTPASATCGGCSRRCCSCCRSGADGLALDGAAVRADARLAAAVPRPSCASSSSARSSASFLPSVGGDIYRAYSLSRHEVRLAESAASVLMDRVLGVLSIVMVGAIAVRVRAATRRPGDRAAAWPASPARLAASRSRCSAIVPRRWRTALSMRLPSATAPHGGMSLTDAMRRYSHHHLELVARAARFGAACRPLRVVQAYCLGRALAIDAAAGYLLRCSSRSSMLVMQLPITISGLGTSQSRSSCSSARPACPRRRPSRSPFCSSRSASSATCRAASSTRRRRSARDRPAIAGRAASRLPRRSLTRRCSSRRRSGSPAWPRRCSYAVVYVACRASRAAPRHRAVRPAASGGWVGGALLGYGLTQLALWAVIVCGLASAAERSSSPGSCSGRDVARRAAPRGRLQRFRMPAWTVRQPRAAAGAAARPGPDGPPYANLGRADADRQSLLPGLLHRRLRLAQRARVRARQVLAAAAQSLPRAAADELLLDLLPVAGDRRATGRPRLPAPTCSAA